jgi:hypothetical protein
MTPDKRLDGFGQRLIGLLNDNMLDTDDLLEALYKLASEMRWVANTTLIEEQPPAQVLVAVPSDQPRIARYAVDRRYWDGTPTRLLAGFDTENEAVKFVVESSIDGTKFYLAVHDREQKRDVFNIGEGFTIGDDPAARHTEG